MAAKGFGAKSIELLGSGNATINSGNDIVLNPNSKVSVAGTFHTIGQILGYNGTAGTTDQVLISNNLGQANWSSITDTNNPIPSSFLQLTDTPTRVNDQYTSNDANKVVTVNTTNTALEFRTNSFLNLSDVDPNSYTSGGKLVAVNSGATGLEFIDSITLTKVIVQGALVENYIKISNTRNCELDLSQGNVFQIVLKNTTNNHTISYINCPASSSVSSTGREAYSFTLIITNTASNTGITWPTSIKWGATGGSGNSDVPARTTEAGKSDVWVFTTYDGGTTWLGVLASFGYTGLP